VFVRGLPLQVAVDRWSRPAWLGLTLVGAAVVVLILANPEAHGLDARGYWSFDPADPYREAVGNLNALTAFRYAPPIALVLEPLHALPWPVFVTLWSVICLAALVYLSSRWALALAALYPVAIELSAGNVNLLIGAAVVAGFRWPATWSFVLLTKVSPGVCLVWFAMRREWRSLGMAFGATAVIAGASWIIVPGMWDQWIAAMRSMIGLEPAGLHLPISLPFRLFGALALVAWGARTNHRWTVLVGATLAMPSIWMATLSPLAGLVRLRNETAPKLQISTADRLAQRSDRTQTPPSMSA
jgi:glycosyl transferase family 87